MVDITRIGDLPCLQDRRVPKFIGDLPVRKTFPEYRDQHFTDGFGLQSDQIGRNAHLLLFRNQDKSYQCIRNIRRALLESYGVWQTNCEEIERKYAASNDFTAGRQVRLWHQDNEYTTTLIRKDSTTRGKTLITTNRMGLHFLLWYGKVFPIISENKNGIRDSINEILRTETEYEDNESVKHQRKMQRRIKKLFGEVRNAESSNLDKTVFLRQCAAHKDCVIAQCYSPEDVERWEHKTQDMKHYNTVSFSQLACVHAADGANMGAGRVFGCIDSGNDL